jgi:hypothetical protein
MNRINDENATFLKILMIQTYISTLTHYPDENGNILDVIHKKHLIYFLAMIVDNMTRSFAEDDHPPPDPIRCHTWGCKGIIHSTLDHEDDLIVWECGQCGDYGRTSGWQGTKWDNL